MKKATKIGIGMIVGIVMAMAAGAATLQTAGTQETKPTGLANLVTIVNANDVALNEAIAALEATESGGALASGKILVGGTNGIAAAVTAAGDVTVAAGGTTAIAAGVIVNADVNASAGIVGSKLDLTSGTTAATLSGTLTANGNTVLGNATNDTLSVACKSVTFSGLPTSTNGLTAGMLWSDSGTLKIKQ